MITPRGRPFVVDWEEVFPADHIKQTRVEWRNVKVITARLLDPNALRPFIVFTKSGNLASIKGTFPAAAAADHAHETMVAKLVNGTMRKERR